MGPNRAAQKDLWLTMESHWSSLFPLQDIFSSASHKGLVYHHLVLLLLLIKLFGRYSVPITELKVTQEQSFLRRRRMVWTMVVSDEGGTPPPHHRLRLLMKPLISTFN